jgi:hypothetical protein
MKATSVIFVALAAGALTLGSTLAAFADTVALRADLTSAAEIPPNSSVGRGQALFTYDTDTNQLEYSVTYEGLSGSATAADIHGPAATNSNAAVIVSFPVPDSPISGTATLNASQAAALLADRLYVDIHTGAHTDGEIRGQIRK